ncbi:MAG: hypothetical protein OEZ47_07425, partial [Gammaproteobacteria bacterium]|nr:hypothetical protein [Gammaproteobacteria bacterium]
MRSKGFALVTTVVFALLSTTLCSAADQSRFAPNRQSDVANTKHNFALTDPPFLAGNPRTVKAVDNEEVCVFCHTPHFSDTTNLA